MFITIINDCSDDNAKARQATRAMALFNQPVTTLGLSQSDIEASGNIIDIIDASYGREGVIMVNVAPRSGKSKKWENGTPFGYFTYRKNLIVSTVDGYTLSLVKKLKITSSVYVTDIPTVIDFMIKNNKLHEEYRDMIVNSQFRSFDYMPRLAKWIHAKIDIPAQEYPIDEIPDMPKSIWWVDNFGNCKTSVLPEEIDFAPGKKLETTKGVFICYDRLKDVPNDEPALITGSSGLERRRFVELVIQGKSASKKFNLSSGDVLFE